MSVITKYYFGTVGASSLTDPALSNVTILCVTRSGTVYSRGVINPTNLKFIYAAGPGRITFANVFNGPPPDQPTSINSIERVSVKYKI